MLTLVVQQSDSAMHMCVCVCVCVCVYIYIYTYTLFNILFHHGLSQGTEGSSQCYTVGHCFCFCFFHPIYKVASASPKVPIKPSPSPVANTNLFSMSESVSFPQITLFDSHTYFKEATSMFTIGKSIVHPSANIYPI